MHEHQQIQQSKNPEPSSQRKTISTKQTNISNTATIIQRVRINPKSLTPADVLQLQRTIGNRAVGRLFSEIGRLPSITQQPPIQRQEIPEEEEKCPSCIQKQEISEEEPLQGKMIETVQRQEIPEEEEPLQGKFKSRPNLAACTSCSASVLQRQEIEDDEKPLQGKMIESIQRQEVPEEEEPLQGKMIGTIQRQEIPEEEEPFQTKRENNTGMPDNLKAGVENLSGIDMSNVRVHYNSSKPAEVGALAYTQGTNIHVAPGQERHLPHEAWHVVQQAQGRVQPTIHLKGIEINDNMELEREASENGERAFQLYKQLKPIQLEPISFAKLQSKQSSNLQMPVTQLIWQGETKNMNELSIELQEGLRMAYVSPDAKPNPLPIWITDRVKEDIQYDETLADASTRFDQRVSEIWAQIPLERKQKMDEQAFKADRKRSLMYQKTQELEDAIRGQLSIRGPEFKWKEPYFNNDGNLPGVAGLCEYNEYYAKPDPATLAADFFWGKNRILRKLKDPHMGWFVSSDHYGTFFKVRDPHA